MDLTTVKRLWRETVGESAIFQTLCTEATYRPADWEETPEAIGNDTEIDQWGEALPAFSPVEEIGRGGMGLVQRAVQNRLDREVAVKSLLGPPTSRSRQNFVAESLANALLEHPNIVPVHDLVRDDRGELLLAMKLVGGESWKDLLARDRADLDRHLEILLSVCNALAFAHSRGIVHNDLKPANVMLGEFGEVLLMDWGLAVAFAEQKAGSRIKPRSAVRSPCGTPAYMAPELAKGEGDLLGPHTDIYLLGAVLYHILEGRPPHHDAGFLQVIGRAISGKIPSLSSTAPTRLKEICQKALSIDPASRHSSVEELAAEIRNFLKRKESLKVSGAAQSLLDGCREAAQQGGSLPEAERNRTYLRFAEAVAGFRQARFLWNENPEAVSGEREAPLEFARTALQHGDLALAEAQLSQLTEPSSSAEEVLNKVRQKRKKREGQRRQRRRLRIGLITALAALVIVLGGTLLLTNRKNAAIERQRHFAVLREEIATEALNEFSTRVQDLLVTQLGTEQAVQVATNALKIAMDGWQRLRETNAAENEISRGTALATLRLGNLYLLVHGRADSAAAHFRRSVAIFERLAEKDPTDERLLGDLGSAYLELGKCLYLQGEDKAALEELRSSYRAWSSLRERGAEGYAIDDELSEVLRCEADCLLNLGEVSLAEAKYLRAISLLRLRAKKGLSLEGRRRLAYSLLGLEEVLRAKGRRQEAEEKVREAIEILERLFSPTPKSVVGKKDLANAYGNLGIVKKDQGDLPEAREAMEHALRLRRELLVENPSSAKMRQDLLVSLLRTGQALDSWGDKSDALELLEESVSIGEDLAGLDETHAFQRRGYLGSLCELFDLQLSCGRVSDARETIEKAVELARSLHDSRSFNQLDSEDLGKVLTRLGNLEVVQGNLAKGQRAYEESCELFREIAAVDAGNFEARRNLLSTLNLQISALCQQGKIEEASETSAEVLQETELLAVADSQSFLNLRGTAKSLRAFGDLLLAEGEIQKARQVFERFLDIGRDLLDRFPTYAEARLNVIAALQRLASARSLLGDTPGSQELNRESLALAREQAKTFPDDRGSMRALVSTLERFAFELSKENELEQAWERITEGVSLSEKLLQLDSSSVQARLDHGIVLHTAAELAKLRTEPEGARRFLDDAVRLASQALEAESTSIQARTLLAMCFETGAELHREAGDRESAERDFRKAVRMRRAIHSLSSRWEKQTLKLARSLRNLADFLGEKGHGELQEAVDLLTDLCERSPERTSLLEGKAAALAELGDLELEIGMAERAESTYVKAAASLRELSRRRPASGQDLGKVLLKLGDAALRNKKLDTAGDIYNESLGIRRGLFASDSLDLELRRGLALGLQRMSWLARARGDQEGCERELRSALRIVLRSCELDTTNWLAVKDAAIFHDELGVLQQNRRDLPAALRSYLEAVACCRWLLEKKGGELVDLRALSMFLWKAGGVAGELGDAPRALALLEEAAATLEPVSDLNRDLSGLFSAILDDLVRLRVGQRTHRLVAGELHPEDYRDWALLGNAWIAAGRDRDAADAFEKALADDDLDRSTELGILPEAFKAAARVAANSEGAISREYTDRAFLWLERWVAPLIRAIHDVEAELEQNPELGQKLEQLVRIYDRLRSDPALAGLKEDPRFEEIYPPSR